MALLCGGGGAAPDTDPELLKHNRDIKKQLDETEANDKAVIKLLLLGAGESGKSTVFKQMRVINMGGFDEAARRGYKSIVWSNTIVSIKALLAAFEKLEVAKPEAVVNDEQVIEDATEDREDLTPELGAVIKRVWLDPTVQEARERPNACEACSCGRHTNGQRYEAEILWPAHVFGSFWHARHSATE
eukprot:2630044-Pleurochrysis_carterae.AAC.4